MNEPADDFSETVDELLLCARGQTPEEAEENATRRAEDEGGVVVNLSVEEGYGGHLACATALQGVETSAFENVCRLNARGVEVANQIARYAMVHPYRVSANGVVDIPDVSEHLSDPTPRKLKRECRKRANSIGRANGWRPVGGGTVRKAYAAPEAHWSGDTGGDDCVVKVAFYTQHDGSGGLDQNIQSATLWEEANDLAAGVMAPIGMWESEFYGWITQRMGDTNDPVVNEEEVADRMEHLKSEGWSMLDLKADNFALLDGELVVIDSGALYPPDEDRSFGRETSIRRDKAREYLRSQSA